MRTRAELVNWYGHVMDSVVARTSKATDSARNGQLEDALNHLDVADTIVVLYESSLINEGVKGHAPAIRSLRRHISKTYTSISMEAKK